MNSLAKKITQKLFQGCFCNLIARNEAEDIPIPPKATWKHPACRKNNECCCNHLTKASVAICWLVSPATYAKVPLSVSSSPFKLSLIWFTVRQAFRHSNHKYPWIETQNCICTTNVSHLCHLHLNFYLFLHLFRSLSTIPSFFSITISQLRILLTWNSRPRYRVTPVISLICFRVKALPNVGKVRRGMLRPFNRWTTHAAMLCTFACIQQILPRYGYHI